MEKTETIRVNKSVVFIFVKGVKKRAVENKKGEGWGRGELVTGTADRKVRQRNDVERSRHDVDHRVARIRQLFLYLTKNIVIIDVVKKRKEIVLRRDETRAFKSAVVVVGSMEERKIP